MLSHLAWLWARGGPRAGFCLAVLVSLALVVSPETAFAHGGDTTYIVLSPHGSVIDGTANLDLVDAEGILKVSRQDLIAGRRRDVVATYLASHLFLDDGRGPCPLAVDKDSIEVDVGALRVTMKFRGECGQAVERINVGFQIFFDAAVYYLGIVRLDGVKPATQLFTSGHRNGTFVLAPRESPADGPAKIDHGDDASGFSLAGLGSAVRAGVEHIWSGADHLLFLLALLMTAVLERTPEGWAPRAGLRASLLDVAKIVTGFTVTHSITLSLAAFELLHPAPRIIEPAIAASVAIAAFDNVHPFLRGKKWVIASSLGLLHGFGFASGLKELAIPHHSLLETLLGFALGIETGQLLFVLAFVPAAFALRKTGFYRKLAVPFGSWIIVALALVWMVQRALPRD